MMMSEELWVYRRRAAEVAHDLADVLDNRHVVFPTVVPELGSGELSS